MFTFTFTLQTYGNCWRQARHFSWHPNNSVSIWNKLQTTEHFNCMMLNGQSTVTPITVHLCGSNNTNQYGPTWHPSVWEMNAEMTDSQPPWSFGLQLVSDSTKQPPGCDLPHQLWSMMNWFRTDKVSVLQLICTNGELHRRTSAHMVSHRE